MVYRFAQDWLLTTSGPCEIVTAPVQLSVADTALSSGIGTSPAQLTVMLAGIAVIVGGIWSLTVMVCVQKELLLLPSMARYVRVTVKRFGQDWLLMTSPKCDTITGPQLSDAVTELVLGGGTSVLQETETVPGQEIDGGV